MNRISVLIADSNPWFLLNVARCLAASRQATIHGIALGLAPSLKHSKYFVSFEEYTGKSGVKSWVHRIGEIVAKRRIDVVLPPSDFAIRTLSEHRQELSWAAKLPQLPDLHTFDIATDKTRFADFLASRSLPHPPTAVVTTGVPVPDKLSALDFPVLAKPSRSSGGDGIRRFDKLEALTTFLAEQPTNERWVVQTLIEGRDLGVNVLCRQGRILAATVQHAIKVSPEPFRPAVGIEFRDDPSAMDIVERLIHELGWSGVANIDMRFDTRRNIPVVLELNGRYWNTLLGSLNAGVNFPLLACEMCLGELRANRKPHSARYFRGRNSTLLSLVGGGRFLIRPYETNLRYIDPLPIAISLAKSAAVNIRNSFSHVLPRLNDGSNSA